MKIDIEQLKTKGVLDTEKIHKMAEEKPLVAPVSSEKIREFGIKANRDREELPDRLPTFSLLPMPIDEHEHIGLYESKQNLYLTFAHAYNRLVQRIEDLEKEVAKLKK